MYLHSKFIKNILSSKFVENLFSCNLGTTYIHNFEGNCKNKIIHSLFWSKSSLWFCGVCAGCYKTGFFHIAFTQTPLISQ